MFVMLMKKEGETDEQMQMRGLLEAQENRHLAIKSMEEFFKKLEQKELESTFKFKLKKFLKGLIWTEKKF